MSVDGIWIWQILDIKYFQTQTLSKMKYLLWLPDKGVTKTDYSKVKEIKDYLYKEKQIKIK